MRPRLIKTGLLFSAAALFFLTAVLPFHHHKEALVKTAPDSHCTVCQFLGTTRLSLSPTPAIAVHFVDTSDSITLSHPIFHSGKIVSNSSPRAPPSLTSPSV